MQYYDITYHIISIEARPRPPTPPATTQAGPLAQRAVGGAERGL